MQPLTNRLQTVPRQYNPEWLPPVFLFRLGEVVAVHCTNRRVLSAQREAGCVLAVVGWAWASELWGREA